MATLVIIRGNSGSGKTSLAKKLQEYYGRKTLLISQDIVRRDMLKEKVKPGNLSISLTEMIARYGYERDLLVIVEGFYETDIYHLKRQFAVTKRGTRKQTLVQLI